MPKSPIPHAVLHVPGGVDDILAFEGNNLATAVETVPRHYMNGSASPSTQRVYFSYFTARVTLTVTQVLICTTSAATPASVTHCQLGLCTVSGAGALQLVAKCADDATIASAASTEYIRSFDATGGYATSYQIVRGTRYAAAYIQVAATLGKPSGNAIGAAATAARSPRYSGSTNTGTPNLLTDLTYPFADASLTAGANFFWMAFLP